MSRIPLISRIPAVMLFLSLFLTATSSPITGVGRNAEDTVRLRVFKLFRISELNLNSCQTAWISVQTREGWKPLRLSPADRLEIAAEGDTVHLVQHRGPDILFSSRISNQPVVVDSTESPDFEFLLSIPGKIKRIFSGRLEIRIIYGLLQPIIHIRLERLAAEAGGAEMAGVTELAALQAQIIAARSFLVSHRNRHGNESYDFCDTTHCQFTQGSRISERHTQAAAATQELVLAYNGKVLPVYYSAVCDGMTLPLLEAAAILLNYPNGSVICPYCSMARKQLPTTQRVVSPISGASNGHGTGLCQIGAVAMARRGATAKEILAHFFPGATVLPFSSLR